MSEQIDRDLEDCTIVRKPCGCVSIMCVTKWITSDTKKEIGDAVSEGCAVEHMTATEARKQQFGCDHEPKQNELFAGAA